MAKRKRLDPATFPAAAASGSGPATAPAAELAEAGPSLRGPLVPPIAQVGGDSAARAALAEVSAAMEEARASGRMAIDLPVSAIRVDHLIRDRAALDDEDLAVLAASIQSRGQQTPIDVTDLGEEAGAPRYGLISGYRRLRALRRLAELYPDDPRWRRVRAVLRRPEGAADAYRAMVEENEVRVGLTYFERARIVAACTGNGVFEDTRTALQTLFAAASRAKRSKIGSYLPIVAALDGVLTHPDAIPERLGLALSKALEADPDLGARLAARLSRDRPGELRDHIAARTANEERAILEAAVAPEPAPAPAPTPAAPAPVPAARRPPAAEPDRERVREDLVMIAWDGRIVLEGPGLDTAFRQRLVDWLRGG